MSSAKDTPRQIPLLSLPRRSAWAKAGGARVDLVQNRRLKMAIPNCRRVILIGLDGLIPDFVLKFANEDVCPNLKKLLERGAFAECWPAPDTLTPTNWVSLATGAWPGTHRITSFSMHYEGKPFTEIYSNQGIMFATQPRTKADLRIEAEFIWDTAIRAGKRCVTINYPGAYPTGNPDLIAVDGEGGGVFSNLCALRPQHYFVYGIAPARPEPKSVKTDEMVASPFAAKNRIEICCRPASNWVNLPPGSLPHLEATFMEAAETTLVPDGSGWRAEDKTDRQYVTERQLWLLVYATGAGYDRVRICTERNGASSLADLSVGAASDWIETEGDALFDDERAANNWGVRHEHHLRLKTRYRFLLEELSPDGRHLALRRTIMANPWGWSQPADLADELIALVDERRAQVDKVLYDRAHRPSVFSQVVTPTSLATYCTALTTLHAVKRYPDWNLLYVQIHSPDTLNHNEIIHLCPAWAGYKEEEAENTWSHFREEYKALDDFVGTLMEGCVDDDTVAVVVSDHGAVATSYRFWHGKFLEDAGLLSYRDTGDGMQVVDFARSRAVPGDFPMTPCVWVNLKGRDPEGIVDPSEYERVRDEIIACLTAVRCPETGEWPYAFVGRREEAAFMGQWGPTSGDVVCLARGNYQNAPGAWCTVGPIKKEILDAMRATGFVRHDYGQHLGFFPNARTDLATVAGTFIIAGPGIRAGYRRRSPVWTVDVVPTLCLLLGIPVPSQCEGAVPLDIFE